MRLFFNLLIFSLILFAFSWGKAVGNLKIIFTEEDLKSVLQEATPISFPKIKGLAGKIYIDHFENVRLLDEDEVLLDAEVKGEKLAYSLSFGGKALNVDIGDVVFYLRLRAVASYAKGIIHYRLALEEQEGRENPSFVGKFVLPLMRAYFSITDSTIEGKDLLKTKTYQRYDDEMEATFLIRGFEVKDKTVTITVGVDLKPKPKE